MMERAHAMQRMKQLVAGPWVPPELGKMPYLWGMSLVFLLWKYFYALPSRLELVLLVATVACFIPLYFASFWVSGRAAVLCVLLACLTGFLWAHANSGAGTFFVFAAGMCGRVGPPRHSYRMLAAVLGLATLAGLAISPYGKFFLLAPWTIGLSVGVAAIMENGMRASRRQLQRKQEEVEHMARIAERERISRDLHDLLGHSLSVIALKAELANKLAGKMVNDGGAERDACRREIADIESTARRALAEVRAAVTGYRHSGLSGALASARVSLLAANIELREDVADFALAPAAEHVLALALREAVTNVVRHAGATRCSLGLALEQGSAVLRVADDGASLRGADRVRSGNGLDGMRERAVALGGKLLLSVDAGLRLELRVPAGVQS
jgi:two-component system sensor histidine kinase DesK